MITKNWCDCNEYTMVTKESHGTTFENCVIDFAVCFFFK